MAEPSSDGLHPAVTGPTGQGWCWETERSDVTKLVEGNGSGQAEESKVEFDLLGLVQAEPRVDDGL